MAQFTMPLKEVVATIYGNTDNPNDYEQTYAPVTFEDVTYGRLPVLDQPEKIGIGTYPIFDEAYRPVLTGKILDEYWNREIGCESIDEFMLNIRRKLDQIMPYYNKLYEAEKIEYDALATMDIRSVSTSEMTGSEDGTSNVKSSSDTDGKARVVSSQTPQTMLSPNADYATSASDTNSDTTVTGESENVTSTNNTSNTSSNNRVTGYQGNASDLVMKYRASLINIDTMVLNDIEDCFMLVLTTGDSFSGRWPYFY